LGKRTKPTRSTTIEGGSESNDIAMSTTSLDSKGPKKRFKAGRKSSKTTDEIKVLSHWDEGGEEKATRNLKKQGSKRGGAKSNENDKKGLEGLQIERLTGKLSWGD